MEAVACSMSEDTAIRYLVECKVIDDAPESQSHYASVGRYNKSSNIKGAVTHSIKYALLRITKTTLVNLYNSSSEPISKEKISALYTIGLGVEKNIECARFWKFHVYNNVKCRQYFHYRKMLKDHILEATKGKYYIYEQKAQDHVKLLDYCDTKRLKYALVYKNIVDRYTIHNIVIGSKVVTHMLYPDKMLLKSKIDNDYSNDVNYVVSVGYVSSLSGKRIEDTFKVVLDTEDKRDILSFCKDLKFNEKNVLTIDESNKIETVNF